MGKVLIQDTTLAGLADSARVITGETKQLSPAEMKEQLVIAEEAIDTQANLLAQLSTILDGKAAGGGGNNNSGGGNNNTSFITNKLNGSLIDLRDPSLPSSSYIDIYNYETNKTVARVVFNIITLGNPQRNEIFTFLNGTTYVANIYMQGKFKTEIINNIINLNLQHGSGDCNGKEQKLCFLSFIAEDEQIDFDWFVLYYNSYICYIKGTQITLANNTTKAVENITYDDELLVWDFDNACYATAKPLWIKKAELTDTYYHCTFENGITLDLVGSNGNCHRVFSLDDNRFEYANNCVGKMVMTELGATKLLSCELVTETVEYYNIATNYHINCYANKVLTSTGLNNLYPIEDMKFIKDDREIIPYESFIGVPEEYYYGLRLGENTDDINFLIDKVKMMVSRSVIKEAKE